MALQGPAPRRCWTRWRLAPPRCRFMDVSVPRLRPRASSGSRARAIPARTATRSRWRPTGPKGWPARCWPPRGWCRWALAPATRCGWRPGSASTARTSTPTPRRSRRTSCGRSRRCGGRAATGPAVSPAPSGSCARSRRARRGCAWASPPRAGRRCARASSCSPARSAWAASPPAASALRSSTRSPWATWILTTPKSAPHSRANCAGSRLPVEVVIAAVPRAHLQAMRRAQPMKYTEEHEWLRVEEDEENVVTVGITEHAAEQLGDLVFVELPEEGRTVVKEDEVVVIESVKAASDILAPVDGEIVEVNERARGQSRPRQRGPAGRGLVLQDPARGHGHARRAHGRGRLQEVHLTSKPRSFAERSPPRRRNADDAVRADGVRPLRFRQPAAYRAPPRPRWTACWTPWAWTRSRR